ncbi:COP9 signalosome complex subunit 7a-like [Amphibalanus amphitrite]|uniref:COP9 signalosome complex subunit 7a-like n=1 Tax=Amphibalanus amphitrite TaxID=1232801 RepID=UPI001C921013|nr:COP9 signalosome complex subunit 7a-like [Amphibalanus amphitrite]XP_043206040.1 COP9 signalosome complex subunit 7a-like [Amphibalanus amphitrite]XP_043206041.1 COP9 signalosome complex subunit 7a-like [Amphibalanus amphitrite]XP_043213084.1 COP9 signalosome complex subunit 7a-like [Amphibalanus amphitrite]XP_043213085.1 COP9 signalosome complex subunit 7a-like [Amphibalanus amphitrite]XP_043213087.1 COP9 signalosome complex subunit 7a-like [Amphibalanus amphitrite]XP_043213088.1 COP9 sig
MAEVTSPSQPLEQFVLLAKSARGAAAAELVRQALDAPGVYVFAELLDMPHIKDLESHAEYGSLYQLLQLFACGVYQDYLRRRQELPQLSDMQRLKLRHLTIVTMSTQTKRIPYADLMKELDLDNTRELEDVIITAIYSDVIRGKLDQLGGQLQVEYAAGRDVRPEAVPRVIATLQAWCQTCDTVMQCIDRQVQTANGEREARARHRAAIEAKVQTIRESLSAKDQDDPMSSDSKETVSTSDRSKKAKTRAAKAGTSKLWKS